MNSSIVSQRLSARGFSAFLMATVSLAVLLPAGAQVASAQERAAAVRYAIPAGPLPQALNRFADTSGLQLVYDAAATRSLRTGGFNGAGTTADVLSRLLAGTGLSYSFTNANTVTITDRVSAAHDAPVDADGSLVLDTITISGGGGAFSPDTPYETAGSSNYISQEQIERFRGTSVGDMLSGTPGVLNADNRLGGGALDVNIRGMQGQGRVPVSVDGAIQETTVYRGYAGIAGRSYVDPDFIGSAMVEKGPSSAADGAGVVGGIVRMNTIGVDDILLPGKSFGVRFKGGFNSNSSSVPPIDTVGGLRGAGTYPNNALPSSFGGPEGMDRPGFLEPTGGSGSVAAGFRSEYIDLVAAYARRKNGNYHAGTRGDGIPSPVIKPAEIWNGTEWVNESPTHSAMTFEGLNRYRAGEEVLNTSQDNKSVLLKGTIRLPYDQQIDLGYMRYESDYGEMMPSQVARGDGAYQALLNSVTMDTYTAKYKWNPSDSDLINLKTGLWMTDVDMTVPNQAYGRGNDATYVNYGDTANKRWGFNVENTSVFDTSFGAVSLTYGGSYTHEDIKPGEGARLNYGSSGNRREVSLFTSGEWKPADWLTLNASLRYSDFKSNDTQLQQRNVSYYTISDGNGGTTEISALEWSTLPDPRPDIIRIRREQLWERDDKSFNGDGLAPIISATVEPWDGIQFYGKYAEAIRLPSLFETTRSFSTRPTAFGLEPEHAKTWEVGLNVLRDDVFMGGDRLRFKANYFNNNVDNYITRTNTPEANLITVNIDKAELRGFEISASYDMGRFFGDLAYTQYTHTNFCVKPGQISGLMLTELCYASGIDSSYIINQLPPKNSLSLTLGTRAFDEKLTVGGRVTYIGKRPTGNIGGAYTVESTVSQIDWKPYTLVDLFASYKVNDQFEIDAAIDNVTDVYYMDALTLGLMPSPGRTFRLNMTAKF
ncbi:hemoglobin/transferrin/lactoferrin receptor protein [Aquamicrobium lusatiense]|uniref:Hemoglobin/transferrin/lactoferrin receptor protein n=1 Tax=Aquamicrobium lusatiense TaxID=89772 RepID=A0A7W9VUU1_9HYPH|nr:TonB-dependent receptor [Aquamicrobium lusatiense]MBB6012378.1 hemoglobin/transferrin/lactoferrin receptor protein [Aquamicrobium lusatiense]